MTNLSLFELNEYIRQVISLNFTDPVWVKAELNQISFSRGHAYLELIEKKENGDEIIAQAQAAIWYRNLKFIEHKTGPHLHAILKKGQQVLLKLKVEYNERYGLKYSVEDVDTSFALGQMELKRREIIQELEKNGLIEKNKKLNLPPVLQKLAIISSEKAAGLQDFINQLQENAYDFSFRCELFSAAMQGKNVEREIIKACNDILGQDIKYDAVILIRGGGSKLDLSAFDTYKLCEKLANMPFPVITGIGHDIDQSIADLIAHTSLKTPTAVANFIIDQNLNYESSLFEKLRAIETLAKHLLHSESKSLAGIADKIKYLGIQIIQKKQFSLNEYGKQLHFYTNSLIKNQYHYLENTGNILEVLNPFALLARGYSITTLNGTLVSSINQVKAGESVETRLSDGIIYSTVLDSSNAL